MYWSTTAITFDQDNLPLWKVSTEHPQRQLKLPEKYWWNKKERKWVKQEYQIEQPIRE